MKIMQRWVWFASVLTVLMGWTARAEIAASVKGNRVNVRSQPSLKGEVIMQLNEGDTVMVLEEIDAENPRRGEPVRWSRIKLDDTTVWVFAPYIETTNYTVNVRRLNVRAGPGEHHGIVGRIERGTPVKQIRLIENWMEIEAPESASGYIASDLLEKSSTPEPPPPDQTTLASNQQTDRPPTTTETIPVDSPPWVAFDPGVAAPTADPLPPPATSEPPAVVDTTPAIRIVTREGTLVYSRSIQSPTMFGIESPESHRIINYVHSEDPEIKVEKYKGKKVIVTGEELIDQRWLNVPILEVHSIQLVP